MRVDYQVTEGVGRITLSNPPQNTLIHPNFAPSLSELESFLDRQELKAVILTGAGRHFCAGADFNSLEELRSDEKALEKALEEGKKALELLAFATVPTVAMIRGSCLGGGLELALACHFRVASNNALLGFPESTLGLVPGIGGTVMVSEVIPRRVAIDLLLSGRMIDTEEAQSVGLVDVVASTKELESETFAFINKLVGSRPTHIIRAVLKSIHNARRLSRSEALREEGRLFLEASRAISHVGSSEDE